MHTFLESHSGIALPFAGGSQWWIGKWDSVLILMVSCTDGIVWPMGLGTGAEAWGSSQLG